jgi:hypothetical protein
MKDGQVKLDETVMTSTPRAILTASQTSSILLVRALLISTLSRPAGRNSPFAHQGVHSLPLSGVHHLHVHTNPQRQLRLRISVRYWRVSAAETEYACWPSARSAFRPNGILTSV